MQSHMMIENPSEVMLTIKITMKAKEWEELRDQLMSGKHPSSELGYQITSAFAKIRKIVYPDEKE